MRHISHWQCRLIINTIESRHKTGKHNRQNENFVFIHVKLNRTYTKNLFFFSTYQVRDSHAEKCISAYADLHRVQCISECVNSQFSVNFPMWKSVSPLADIRRVQCISACVNSRYYVIFPMWKSVSPLADLHKVQWITACGDTIFNVNSLMRKSVLPHADIHEKIWISQDKEIH